MPSKAPTPCSYPLCPNLAVSNSRCLEHPKPPRPYGPGYGRVMPSGWDATRARILERDAHTCQACGAPATDVDHIIRGGGEHDANLQSLCQPCHDAKSAAEAAAARHATRHDNAHD